MNFEYMYQCEHGEMYDNEEIGHVCSLKRVKVTFYDDGGREVEEINENRH
jgi:hypothetical protein